MPSSIPQQQALAMDVGTAVVVNKRVISRMRASDHDRHGRWSVFHACRLAQSRYAVVIARGDKYAFKAVLCS